MRRFSAPLFLLLLTACMLAGGYREGRIEPTDQSWIIYLSKG